MVDRLMRQSSTASAAVVLRPGERCCEVDFGSKTALVGYGVPFSPRTKTLMPGHLVAVIETPAAGSLILWRWYDAVVLEQSGDQVRLWEPAHGEVLAQSRHAEVAYPVGTRAYASAGLPGAEWWVEGLVSAVEEATVPMNEVFDFYDQHDLWHRLT